MTKSNQYARASLLFGISLLAVQLAAHSWGAIAARGLRLRNVSLHP